MLGIFQAQDEQGEWFDVIGTFEPRSPRHLYVWLIGLDQQLNPGIVPLSTRRGLPTDFVVNDKRKHPIEANCYRGRFAPLFKKADITPGDQDCLLARMGDSFHSWLDADEILNAPDQLIGRAGAITRHEHLMWSGQGEPEHSAIVLDANITCLSDEDDIGPDTTHVWVKWEVSLRDELSPFIDEVRRLRAIYSKVRFVFGFDLI